MGGAGGRAAVTTHLAPLTHFPASFFPLPLSLPPFSPRLRARARQAQNPSALMEETPLVHALTMALIQNHDVMFEKMPEKVRI